MTKDNNASSKAMVPTDEGKNWGVSTDTTKPCSEPTMIGEPALSDTDDLDTLLTRNMHSFHHFATIGAAGDGDKHIALVSPGKIIGCNTARLWYGLEIHHAG